MFLILIRVLLNLFRNSLGIHEQDKKWIRRILLSSLRGSNEGTRFATSIK